MWVLAIRKFMADSFGYISTSAVVKAIVHVTNRMTAVNNCIMHCQSIATAPFHLGTSHLIPDCRVIAIIDIVAIQHYA